MTVEHSLEDVKTVSKNEPKCLRKTENVSLIRFKLYMRKIVDTRHRELL